MHTRREKGKREKERDKKRGKYFSAIRLYWQETTENIARIYERQKPKALSSGSNTFGVDALYCVCVNSLYLLAFFDSVESIDSYIDSYIDR